MVDYEEWPQMINQDAYRVRIGGYPRSLRHWWRHI